ncbi:hypothetical protein M9Y10_024388 [Tritrichomonas musculus]|uniref:mitogen-activated protein kinase kinase n=1 Tax=Tritrichomonas musculus TaxID=1915356 RepID=A0ABR2HBS7_9EUKA
MSQMSSVPSFKFILIGESETGKSSLISRLISHDFNPCITRTIGADFYEYNTKVENNPVQLVIWDTSGAERYYTTTKSYFRMSLGILVVFDITNRSSFNSVPRWINDVKKEASPNCQILLVGNKKDLTDQRVVSTEEAELFANKYKIKYIETSALADENVERAFTTLTTDIYNKTFVSQIKPVSTLNADAEKPVKTNKTFDFFKNLTSNQSEKKQLNDKIKQLEASLINKTKEFEDILANKLSEIDELKQKIQDMIKKHDEEIRRIKEESSNKNQDLNIRKNISFKELRIIDSEEINNIEQIELIGSGGGGNVFKVAKKVFYALKRMKICKTNISTLKQFLSEYEILNMLNHPNIIKAYGIFLSDETNPASILLEYCPTNLDKLVTNQSLDNIQIVKLIYQIVEGMKYVHFNKIIHRDLKPSNILITDDLTVKICDFGISKLMTTEEQSMTRGLGTQKFMAPEIVNEEDYDEKADVYSFGVLLFFVLSNGKMPKITIPQIGNGKKAEIPSSFTSFATELINSCWNFDPKDRPSFIDIEKELKDNNYCLLPLTKSEVIEVTSFIKNHKSTIPQYST